jgi:hypothetical protein
MYIHFSSLIKGNKHYVFSICVLGLITQHGNLMRRITCTIQTLGCPGLKSFRFISLHVLVSEKRYRRKICVLNKSAKLSRNVVILKIIDLYFTMNVHRFKCTVPVTFVRF